ARGGQVDLVDADAEGADGDQLRRRLQQALRDLRTRPDAQQAHVADGLDELILAERARQRVDLIARLDQPRRRVGVDVLEQQRPRRHQTMYLSCSWARSC